ncbi:MAG: hypothetical protein P4L74_02865 [Candidatus Doudnabacteria bacterium]|nr:hypothetical protein [Candidatus Doudnabacteria bacterium]
MNIKLSKGIKIILAVFIVFLFAAVFFAAWYHPKLTSAVAQSSAKPEANHPKTAQPPGTCAPDLSACKGNAELCMKENINPVCD